jgi:hypothetical protein
MFDVRLAPLLKLPKAFSRFLKLFFFAFNFYGTAFQRFSFQHFSFYLSDLQHFKALQSISKKELSRPASNPLERSSARGPNQPSPEYG